MNWLNSADSVYIPNWVGRPSFRDIPELNPEMFFFVFKSQQATVFFWNDSKGSKQPPKTVIENLFQSKRCNKSTASETSLQSVDYLVHEEE